MKLNSFKEIAKNYKVIFFDSYGVLKNYNGLINGVQNVLDDLRAAEIEYYILINNASRRPSLLIEGFKKLGLNDMEEKRMITSGMMAKEYLRYKVSTGKIAYMGPRQSEYYIESLGLEPIHLFDLDKHEPEEIRAFLFLDDEGFDWFTMINQTINLLRRNNIPAIVANSDLVYPISREEVSVAIGGLAILIEHIVQKRFIKFGKPDSQMFMYAYEKLLEYRDIDKSEILLVGDTLHTDIQGGNKFGLDTALVLSGNTLPHRVKAKIKDTGIIPDYVCESIGT